VTEDKHQPLRCSEQERHREQLKRTYELARELEVNSWRQAEYHVTAAGFWGTFQWIVGGASAVLAAVASGTAFAEAPVVAGVLALLGAGAASIVTELRPAEWCTAGPRGRGVDV
jgi:hypothetical protein